MDALQKSSLCTLRFSDRFENNFFGNRFEANPPAVNIKENFNEFKVEVAAPGLKKDDFKITTENGMINISAKHEENKEEKDENYTRREYNYNSFCRSFTLPANIKSEDIKSNYENGILKLSLPKKAKAENDSKKKQLAASERAWEDSVIL